MSYIGPATGLTLQGAIGTSQSSLIEKLDLQTLTYKSFAEEVSSRLTTDNQIDDLIIKFSAISDDDVAKLAYPCDYLTRPRLQQAETDFDNIANAFHKNEVGKQNEK